MFILTVEGKETEGAYSVQDDHGEQVLYLFEDEDDAIRVCSFTGRSRLSRNARS